MYSETQHAKEPPLKCQCHINGSPDCGELLDKSRAENHQKDIEDVTDSVMKVMRICGLKPLEVTLAQRVIRRSFMYFEELVERIDRVPRKRFGKESFLHGLAHEAQMSRMDAQMAYAIAKRAFKAFYYGTGVEGRPDVALQAKLLHRDDCMWLRAAHRTAEIHAVLAGLMYSEQLLFGERIESVYKSLVDVLRSRLLWDNDNVCSCGRPASASARAAWPVPGLSQAESIYSGEVEVLYRKEIMGASSAPSKTSLRTGNQSRVLSTAATPRNHGLRKANHTVSNKQTPLEASADDSLDRPRCNCPRLRYRGDGGVAREAPEITAECSQGPYICRWLAYDGEEAEFPEHCVPCPPMEDLCPPCPTDDLPCDPECTCTCEVCTCRPAFDDGQLEEENLGEKLSNTGLEDHDTDFCWVGPFRGSSRERMAWQRTRDEMRAKEELSEEEEEDFECRCTCEAKQRACPHLFTYLTDFKDKEPVQEEPQPEAEKSKSESESEDLLSKPPPYGITLDTYRCWVKPESSKSGSSESSGEIKPPLLVVLGEKPEPEVQITIKKQHADQVTPAQGAEPLPKAPGLPHKPTPTPAPSKPPLTPQKPEDKEDKMTKEEVLDIIGLRFKQKK